MEWFLDPGGEIGGEGTPRAYLLVFTFGVLVGSVVRLGMFLLPSATIDALRDRLLPGQQARAAEADRPR